MSIQEQEHNILMKNITANHIQHHTSKSTHKGFHRKKREEAEKKFGLRCVLFHHVCNYFPFLSRFQRLHSTSLVSFFFLSMKLAKCYKQKLDGTRETCVIPVAFISIFVESADIRHKNGIAMHNKAYMYACMYHMC